MPKRSQSGFTLLELMMVVVLIGMATAIGVPSYRGYVDSTNQKRAIAEVGGLAVDLYRWELNTGGFPDTLAEAGLDGLRDPWGNPYVYLNIATADRNAVRKDKNLHPLNTDFDLYSKGKDQDTQLPLTAQTSQDDIVRANNGSFIGLGKNY
jgi:general secretion pathway protein G